jgi:hypothetical protein
LSESSAGLDEVVVEFDSGHREHVYVGDQAGRDLGEVRYWQILLKKSYPASGPIF